VTSTRRHHHGRRTGLSLLLAAPLALAACLAMLGTGGCETRTPSVRAPQASDERPSPTPSAKPTQPAPPADFQPPDAAGWGRAGELRYLEVVKGGASADQKLPLVVMIHGLGDRPRDVWVEQSGVPMRVVMPQAPEPHGDGYAWFPYRVGDNDPVQLARGVAHAAGQLARALELLAQGRPTAGRPIVGGFSQGGMLSYALAILHPQVLGEAYPISGMLPRPLWPAAGPVVARPLPIRAQHGDADEVVSIAPARALGKHLRALGYDMTLQEVPGVGHRITPEMSTQFGARIDEAATRAAVQL